MIKTTSNLQTGDVSTVSMTAKEIASLPVLIPHIPTKEEQEAARRQAYILEADPLAMKMLRDAATKEEWLAKIAEIKARYPDPVGA